MNFKKWLEADYQNSSEENFWGNVGAGILPFCPETKRFLIAYRSIHVNEPNTWGVWGGKVDDEDLMNLQGEAKREFEEETGYSGSISLIPAYVFKSPGGGFEYHNFIGILSKEFNPKHNWETENHKWLTLEELFKLEPKHFGLSALLKNSYNLITNLVHE